MWPKKKKKKNSLEEDHHHHNHAHQKRSINEQGDEQENHEPTRYTTYLTCSSIFRPKMKA
jgi:hypothetical protein